MEGFVQQLQEMKNLHSSQQREMDELMSQIQEKEIEYKKLSVRALEKQRDKYQRKQEDNSLKISIIQCRLRCDYIKEDIQQAQQLRDQLQRTLHQNNSQGERIARAVKELQDARSSQRDRCISWMKECRSDVADPTPKPSTHECPQALLDRRKSELRQKIQAASDRLTAILQENSVLQEQLDQFESALDNAY